MSLPLKYYKRFRMSLSLGAPRQARRTAPQEFLLAAWRSSLLDHHAEALYRSFVDDLDALLFPNLAHPLSARDVMRSITERRGFCPKATWLMLNQNEPIGTIQGILLSSKQGAIQNLGVVPGFRGAGIGRSLLLRSLQGFQSAGVREVILEVTAENLPAVRLYRSLGFRSVQTIYKPVLTTNCRRQSLV